MVEKKEGATMTCKQCGTDVICRTKDYGGNYAPSLQWQNHNGDAHYKTTDGKNFTCNVPVDNDIENPTVPGIDNSSQQSTTSKISDNKLLDEISLQVEKIYDMVQAIFHHTVNEQLKKK